MHTSEGAADPRNLRVSDTEREHVVSLLQKAIGRGLLDLEEFTERTDTALAAKTRGELNTVLLDLPGLVHSAAPRVPIGDTASGQRAELTAGMSTLRRDGEWVVPRHLVVRTAMGGVRLDFRRARIDHDEVHVELRVGMGSVRLRLPDGATVNTDGLHFGMGRVHGRIGDGDGTPRFVITGQLSMGSLYLGRRGLFG